MKQLNMAKIFKALSNEQRLELFKLIYSEAQLLSSDSNSGECICKGVLKAFTHACSVLKISRSTISHHFKELENAGLIICEKRGQSNYCEVNQDAIDALKGFLD